MTAPSRIGVVLAALACGCASAPPREDVVYLLKSLGKGYQHRDAQEVAQAYAEDFRVEDPLSRSAVETSDEGRVRALRSHGTIDKRELVSRLERTFAELAEVDKAKFVLDWIEEHEDGWEFEAWFEFIAEKADGTRTFEDARHRFVVAEDDEDHLQIVRHQVLSRSTVEGSVDHFSDRTEAVGLAGVHRPHTPIEEGTPIIPGNFSGAGACAGDVDADGWLDLIVGDGQRVRLFRNRGDGTFEEATDRFGLGAIGLVRAAYFFDYDDDGRLDLLFTRVRQPTMLWRNVDGTRFEDVSPALGGERPGQGESVVLADFDLDGDVDVYELRYGDFNDKAWAYPLYNAQDGSRPVVRRNRGDGTFELLDPEWAPTGWGLAATSGDYDDDGDPDIYIANDFGVNRLLRNDGDFEFTDVTNAAGCSDQGLGMSASFGDVDGDGDLDLYVANMQSSASWVFDDPDFPLPVVADLLLLRGFVREEMRKITRGNSLFLNDGDGHFEQVASAWGAERNGWSWGANMLDYDNDGDLDIYCPNGYITGAEPDDL